jgi:hypothetical protein
MNWLLGTWQFSGSSIAQRLSSEGHTERAGIIKRNLCLFPVDNLLNDRTD